MATITPMPPYADQAPSPSGPHIRRVSAAGRDRALGLLLTGRPEPSPAAAEPFLRFTRHQSLPLTGLWAAYEEDRAHDAAGHDPPPRAAALVLPSAGATAMLFLSPIPDRSHVPLARRVVRATLDAEDPDHARLVQVLLDPAQALERAALEAVGLQHLARLVYMQRPLDPADPPARPPDLTRRGGALRHWREDRRDLFERAILASYADTLDCPGLLGMRRIDQILASHMATGRFDPSLWSVYVDTAGEPAAVVLLSEVHGGGAHELVYLGVAKAARGRGLGEALLKQGLWQAAAAGGTKMVLAVDDHNTPAIKLYRRLGFRSHLRKTALIRGPRDGGSGEENAASRVAS